MSPYKAHGDLDSNSWNETRGLDMETSVEYCRIPDVDNDSIPDGKEIHGYEVKIITGWKDDGTPKSEMRTVDSSYLDPLIPYGYNSTEGMEWSDTDDDGIPDVVESLLSNSSYFLDFYNFTHKDDWMENYRKGLWNNYSWAIAYYFSIKLHKKWDVIYTAINGNDGVSSLISYNSETEHNKSCLENATNYLTSQFNPFVKEREPPMMMKFNLQAKNGKLYYHILLRDAGKIANVLINDVTGSEFYVNSNINSVVFEHSGYFNLSVSEQIFKVDIEVVSYDSNGWKLDVEKEVNGPLGEWVDIVTQYFSELFHLFVEIGKIVAKGVNVIVEWLEGLFMGIVNKIIDTITSIVSGLVSVYGALLSAVASIVNGDKFKNDNTLIEAIKRFVDTIIEFHWILIGTFIAVMGVMLVIKAASMGIEQVVETALFTATKNLVISMLVGLLIPGLWESISKLVNKKETSLPRIWDFILNYLGITVSYGATIIGIIETTVESLERKSFSWFFAGLTLAVSGFFLDAATTAYHLTGAWLQAADLAGCLLSYFGLIIMIVTSYRDPTETSIEKVSPLLAILQWIIAIGGFAKAIIDGIADAKSGWE